MDLCKGTELFNTIQMNFVLQRINSAWDYKPTLHKVTFF
jgi:hypothetical protein